MGKFLALFALMLSATAFGLDDPVEKALHYDGSSHPFSQPGCLDQALKTLIDHPIKSEETKYPAIAEGLNRLAKLDPASIAEAERLFKNHILTPENRNTRALFPTPLRPEEARPDKADLWLYVLLKPDWSASVNGARIFCLDAIRRCDAAKAWHIMPEWTNFLFSKNSGFPPQSTLVYSLFCFAYTEPNDKGLAEMKAIHRTGQDFFSGDFISTFRFFLEHPSDKGKAEAWNKLLAAELDKPNGDKHFLEAIRQIFKH